MVKKIGTFRRKTRHKLGKKARRKGKIGTTRYFQLFEIGNKVGLVAESSIAGGMYRPRFHGKIGVIKGRQGVCYKVAIKDGGKEKLLILHPAHLKKLG